jgi:hypothetical protein
MLLSLLALDTRPVWYGPLTATFEIQVPGNPYDPDQNDLKVKFIPERGNSEERLAYADTDGTIKAVLVTQNPGKFRAILLRNGKEMLEPPKEGILEAKQPLPNGFIHVNPAVTNRFEWDSGAAYYPVGFDLGWQNGNFIPMADQISKMAAAGVNWTRIWASNWDDKNPWWPQGDGRASKTELWPKAIINWQGIVAACDQVGLPFQMVLFNHGSFSSKVNPNWPDHPWNAKNGGFLQDASDFFTDKEAKRRAKMWLRYAVARWAASPNVMAWELFNEVEWVDARYANRWGDIADWHKEMADYLRSIDPYHHLITTSSAMDQKALWATMDYYQPHTYPPNVLMAVAGYEQPGDKPLFFGEFGTPVGSGEPLKAGLRDGIYGAMLANQAGAAELWYWDAVEKENLYPIFTAAQTVLRESDLARHPNARQLDLKVATPGSATLKFGPGQGWAQAGQTTFEIPSDINPKSLAKLPGYFQNQNGGNKALFPKPLVFEFSAKTAGKFRMSIDQVSSGGAKLAIYLNGEKVVTKDYPATDKGVDMKDVLEVPFGAGQNNLRIENNQGDWVRVGGFEFSGLSPQASGMALGESDWLMVRLTAADEVTSPPKVDLAGLSIADGTYDLTIIDLIGGGTTKAQQAVSSFALRGFQMPSADVMLIYKRKL